MDGHLRLPKRCDLIFSMVDNKSYLKNAEYTSSLHNCSFFLKQGYAWSACIRTVMNDLVFLRQLLFADYGSET
jgi:hypothetical protein